MKLTGAIAALLILASQLHGQITPEEYGSRRERLAKEIGTNAMLVVTSPPPAHRNGDVDYPYRQDDDLLYLTGIAQPGTSLVLMPGEAQYREVLFISDRDPRREVWTGKLMSADDARRAAAIREVAPASEFRQFLEAALAGRPFGPSDLYSYYRGPSMPAFREAMLHARAELWLPLGNRGTRDAESREITLANELGSRFPELRIRNAQALLFDLRQVKTPAELALIQKAIDITAEAEKQAMRRIRTATSEAQVQATIEFTFRDMGADGWGFPSIVASGENGTTLHYESDNGPIDRKGLLVADIGAEVSGYSADVTRTFPASGTFSDAQRDIYSAVLTAQNEVLALMRPGAAWKDIHTRAVDVLGRELARLGLVSRNEPAQTKLYFVHGVGHPLGLQVHDVFEPERKLEPGMVITNEPGIYVRRADVLGSEVFRKLPADEQKKITAALDRYAGIGVRIEDDVLITVGEPRVMSAAAPRAIAEIEAWMKGK